MERAEIRGVPVLSQRFGRGRRGLLALVYDEGEGWVDLVRHGIVVGRWAGLVGRWRVTGWPRTVINRGRIIVENETLLAERGSGRFLDRSPLEPKTEGFRGETPLNPLRTFGADLADKP